MIGIHVPNLPDESHVGADGAPFQHGYKRRRSSGSQAGRAIGGLRQNGAQPTASRELSDATCTASVAGVCRRCLHRKDDDMCLIVDICAADKPMLRMHMPAGASRQCGCSGVHATDGGG